MTVHEQASHSGVHLGSMGFPHGEALGVLCGEWIFTCAHYLSALPLEFHTQVIIEAWRAADATRGDFSVLHASIMDFMILAPDGMIVGSSDGAGPTESSWDVIYAAAEAGFTLNPCAGACQSDSNVASVDGLVFGQDGKTTHSATFELRRYSALITFDSNDTAPGCSGGPLFTNAGQLIGVFTHTSRVPINRALHHCIGRRIDLCIPLLFSRPIPWEFMLVGTTTPKISHT
jgi:hypothetical protein